MHRREGTIGRGDDSEGVVRIPAGLANLHRHLARGGGCGEASGEHSKGNLAHAGVLQPSSKVHSNAGVPILAKYESRLGGQTMPLREVGPHLACKRGGIGNGARLGVAAGVLPPPQLVRGVHFGSGFSGIGRREIVPVAAPYGAGSKTVEGGRVVDFIVDADVNEDALMATPQLVKATVD